MGADVAGFEAEFMDKLKKERLVFVSEAVDMGKKHGIDEPEVERLMERAEKAGLGFRETVFVYGGEP